MNAKHYEAIWKNLTQPQRDGIGEIVRTGHGVFVSVNTLKALARRGLLDHNPTHPRLSEEGKALVASQRS